MTPRRAAAAAVIVASLVLAVPARTAGAQAGSAEILKLVEAGRVALEERRFADALASFTAASKLAPSDASIVLGIGVSALMLGQDAEAERQLERALNLEPRLTDASVILGELQYRRGHISQAIATYEAALTHAPKEQRLSEKIDAWTREARAESRFAETRGAHFRVLFEGPVDQALARRAVELLEGAYRRVGESLAFYPGRTIDVVLYTAQQFRDVTRTSEWAGGLFDGRIRVPVRGALDRLDELERVLTHEYVHALIAGVSGRDLPAWVNEGLAVVSESGGLADAQRVVASAVKRPALRELHDGFGDLPLTQAGLAYAESAVAVRTLLDLRGPSALVTLLRDVGAGAPFASAFHQRMGMRYEEFQALVVTKR